MNIGSGKKKARWVIQESDLETLAALAIEGGKLPVPKGGWPTPPKGGEGSSKKADGLAACAD
jgi:hypothetical protein